MSVLERYLGELEVTKSKVAVESLAPDSEKTEWGYGHACGMQAGLRLAAELFEKLLSEQEESERGKKPAGARAARY